MDDEDQVSLKALYEDNDNMIDMLEESIDHCKVTGEKEVVSDYGVKGIVYLYNHWMDTDIGRMDGKGWFYCFPSPEDNRWFIIYLMYFTFVIYKCSLFAIKQVDFNTNIL